MPSPKTAKPAAGKAPAAKKPAVKKAKAVAAPPESLKSAPTDSVDALHEMILKSLDDDQAVETISIPLAGKSTIADHMIIASGRSTRQVASMAQKLQAKIKQDFGRTPRIEGMQTADWVLIDAGDIIIHLFRPEVRSFYNLERMWAFGDAPPVAATA